LAKENYASYRNDQNNGVFVVNTTYSKVRIDPCNFKVNITDITFATTKNTKPSPQPSEYMLFGTAGSCDDESTGNALIDLSGTPFHISDVFITNGFACLGQATFSTSAQVASITGGGFCGATCPQSASGLQNPPFCPDYKSWKRNGRKAFLQLELNGHHSAPSWHDGNCDGVHGAHGPQIGALSHTHAPPTPTPPPSFDCSSNVCITNTKGTGVFNTLAVCKSYCHTPAPTPPPSLPTPNLDVAKVPDPRPGAAPGTAVSVVGFYGSHHNQIGPSAVDSACNATFLGNWWTPVPLNGFAPPAHASDPHSFVCSEAAYWAVQWWDPRARSFKGLNGQQAFELALKLINASVPQDPLWGGFGSKWVMMNAILRTKFKPGSQLAGALLSTVDAYLVEHQEGYDSDNAWSDFCDGTGSNWLGLALMRVRDELQGGRGGASSWTAFADAAYSPVDGTPLPGQAAWLETVQTAATALNAALPYTCPPRTGRN
jgi:hypothetical protein